ncbi:hypothetical protein EVAR_37436_1 [Eumeta japonica]|uniref:Uncharacterized protein n=1 Tax=Eumeta variegata TaxID=151549 RepID=A0A4C1X419_EUMVA|nr:hypothetical protein EVAR_37436_1 [Eumeta japonica]
MNRRITEVVTTSATSVVSNSFPALGRYNLERPTGNRDVRPLIAAMALGVLMRRITMREATDWDTVVGGPTVADCQLYYRTTCI